MSTLHRNSADARECEQKQTPRRDSLETFVLLVEPLVHLQVLRQMLCVYLSRSQIVGISITLACQRQDVHANGP